MAVNHVIINGETVVDLRNDTVSADKLLKGATAHDKTGAAITGTLNFPHNATGRSVSERISQLFRQFYLALCHILFYFKFLSISLLMRSTVRPVRPPSGSVLRQ